MTATSLIPRLTPTPILCAGVSLETRLACSCMIIPLFTFSVQCLPANTCEEAVRRLITEEYTRCCDGFTSRPLDDRVFAIYYNYWDVLEPPGCPVGKHESVGENPYNFDCLFVQQTTFIVLIGFNDAIQ